MRFSVPALLIVVAAAAAPAWPADQPDAGPNLPAVVVEQPPVIDGKLDDAAWAAASHLLDFMRSDVERPAAEQTEAWVCLDRGHLYAAFRCHDRQPGRIRADQTKRSAGLSTDDHVMLMVDPVHDHQDGECFCFYVNPRGTQDDTVPGGTATQIGWKGDWQAAARMTETGWEAEIAVPLAMLRYPTGQQTFGLRLGRHLEREKEDDIWPFLGAPVIDPFRQANLTGLTLPKPRLPTVVMPYTLSQYERGGSRPLVSGVDIKHTFVGGAVGLLTVNPDFSAIEDQVLSIDYTYTERYQPDRRPFFLEGAAALPDRETFYTHRLRDLDVGLKAWGITGPVIWGALSAVNPGDSVTDVAMLSLETDPDSSYSLGVVDHRADEGPSGLSLIADTWDRVRLHGSTLALGTRYTASDTEGDRGNKFFGRLRWDRGSNHTMYLIEYYSVSRGFRPAIGYNPEVGLSELSLQGDKYAKHAGNGRVQESETWWWAGAGPALDGHRQALSGGHWVGLRGGRSFSVGGHLTERGGHTDRTMYLGTGWNRSDLYRGGSLYCSFGRQAGGGYLYTSLSQGWKLAKQAYGDLSLEYVRMTSPQSPLDDWQLVAGGGWDFSPERSVHCRLVGRSGALNAYASYRQEVRKGVDAFMVLGDPNAERTTKRVAVKLVWPLLY